MDNAIDQLNELEHYAKGAAAAFRSSGDQDLALKLDKMAEWLRRAKHNTCGQGFVGCRGGYTCESDHK